MRSKLLFSIFVEEIKIIMIANLRQRYLNMRNTQKLDANFLYMYYKDKGGTADMNQFMGAANMYDFNSLYDKLDSEFEINILFTKEGNFVRAYGND